MIGYESVMDKAVIVGVSAADLEQLDGHTHMKETRSTIKGLAWWQSHSWTGALHLAAVKSCAALPVASMKLAYTFTHTCDTVHLVAHNVLMTTSQMKSLTWDERYS